MQTQLSITVKDEFILHKFFTFTWFVQIFKKSRMKVRIDGENHILTASKEPYVFDVTPGVHEVVFSDYLENAKNRLWKCTFGFMGFAFGLGGAGSAIDGAIEGAKFGEVSKKSTVLNVTLEEGDVLNLVCQTKARSKVKVKTL